MASPCGESTATPCSRPRDGAAILRMQRDIWEYVKDFKPDVIHSHDGAVALWLYLRLTRNRPHAPVVLTLHNVMSQQYAGNETGAPRADHAHGARRPRHRSVRRRRERRHPSDARGRGEDLAHSQRCRGTGLAATPVAVDGRARFLAIGRLVTQKGFDHAIAAVAQLAPRHPDLRLTIVGVGECARARSAGPRARRCRQRRVRGDRRARRHPRPHARFDRAADALAVRRAPARRARGGMDGPGCGGHGRPRLVACGTRRRQRPARRPRRARRARRRDGVPHPRPRRADRLGVAARRRAEPSGRSRPAPTGTTRCTGISSPAAPVHGAARGAAGRVDLQNPWQERDDETWPSRSA